MKMFSTPVGSRVLSTFKVNRESPNLLHNRFFDKTAHHVNKLILDFMTCIRSISWNRFDYFLSTEGRFSWKNLAVTEKARFPHPPY